MKQTLNQFFYGPRSKGRALGVLIFCASVQFVNALENQGTDSAIDLNQEGLKRLVLGYSDKQVQNKPHDPLLLPQLTKVAVDENNIFPDAPRVDESKSIATTDDQTEITKKKLVAKTSAVPLTPTIKSPSSAISTLAPFQIPAATVALSPYLLNPPLLDEFSQLGGTPIATNETCRKGDGSCARDQAAFKRRQAAIDKVLFGNEESAKTKPSSFAMGNGNTPLANINYNTQVNALPSYGSKRRSVNGGDQRTGHGNEITPSPANFARRPSSVGPSAREIDAVEQLQAPLFTSNATQTATAAPAKTTATPASTRDTIEHEATPLELFKREEKGYTYVNVNGVAAKYPDDHTKPILVFTDKKIEVELPCGPDPVSKKEMKARVVNALVEKVKKEAEGGHKGDLKFACSNGVTKESPEYIETVLEKFKPQQKDSDRGLSSKGSDLSKDPSPSQQPTVTAGLVPTQKNPDLGATHVDPAPISKAITRKDTASFATANVRSRFVNGHKVAVFPLDKENKNLVVMNLNKETGIVDVKEISDRPITKAMCVEVKKMIQEMVAKHHLTVRFEDPTSDTVPRNFKLYGPDGSLITNQEVIDKILDEMKAAEIKAAQTGSSRSPLQGS